MVAQMVNCDAGLNRLTGDVQWPVDTPFETAVGECISPPPAQRPPLPNTTIFAGPLAHAFPLLSLRTSKADVVVGIPRSVADALDARDERWRVSGRYVKHEFLVAILHF